MVAQSKILELKYLRNQALEHNRTKIDDIISGYKDRSIEDYRIALSAVKALASKNVNLIKSGKPDKLYNKALYGDEFKVSVGDLTNPLTNIKFYFNQKYKQSDEHGLETRSINKIKQLIDKTFEHEIDKILKIRPFMKMSLKLTLEMSKDSSGFDDEIEQILKVFPIETRPIRINSSNYKLRLKNLFRELDHKINKLSDSVGDSKWKIKSYISLNINLMRIRADRASSYIETPLKYKNSSCGLINIQNDDDHCFMWCMKYHQSGKNKHDDRVSVLKKINDKYSYEGINFPASYDDIQLFENKNKIAIFVYALTDDNQIYVEYEGNVNFMVNDICYLLKVENNETSHYIYIKNIDRFVNINKDSNRKCKDCHFCPICQGKFPKDKYQKHLAECRKFHNDSTILELPETGSKMKFRNHKNRLRRPAVAFLDFESSQRPEDDAPALDRKGQFRNQKITRHEPNSAHILFTSDLDIEDCEYIAVGDDCVIQALRKLNRMEEIYYEEYKDCAKIRMTREDEIDFEHATQCYLCNEDFKEVKTKKNKTLHLNKNRDHDHRTGKYRGAACTRCNINFFTNRYLPVFVHNLRGYDSHFIIKKAQEIAKELGISDIKVIPNSHEKFMSFTIGRLKFIDSYQFMGSSLDKLVKNLYDPNDKYKNFNYSKKFNPKSYKLLCQKGYYPYDWVDSLEKLNYPGLPPIEAFYSKVKGKGITQKEYEHAQKVYKELGCKTFRDYHIAYLKSDVYLLADVFTAFRNNCLNYYQLDPANYISAPGLAWDAMLLMTKIELDLITDINMFNYIEQGKRGGLCMVGSNRSASANNKYLPEFDSSKPSTYLMYWDCNNLYGHSMTQPLPYKNLKFDNSVDINTVLNTPDDSSVGYYVKLNYRYPIDIHDKLREYPPAPENMSPNIDNFSSFQIQLGRELNLIDKNDNYNSSNKLIPHLLPHENYVLHYRNLKFLVNLGIEILEVKEIISFDQKPWLKEYIDFNTEMRKQAKDEFEKDFFKLMNNSVFGKTMEDVKNRIKLDLTTKYSKAERLFSDVKYKRCTYFDGLFIIERYNINVKCDKPIYVGTSILDLSKLQMMDFHYNVIHANFENRYKLIYSDTDSLVYLFEDEDIYSWIKSNSQHFDLSDDRNQPDNTNKKVLGKFKDELHGLPLKEFVALNAKVYSMVYQKFNEETKQIEDKNTKKCKGIPKSIVENELHHEDYKEVIRTRKENKKTVTNINSKHHQIFTTSTNKTALSTWNDKAQMLDDQKSVPFGYRINSN